MKFRTILAISCILLPSILFAQNSNRKSISLDSEWKFGLSNVDSPSEARSLLTAEVNVPHTWNNLDMQSGKNYHVGAGWYEKHINLTSEQLKSKQLFLKFDGVCSVADIYVNDRFLGEHKGGFSAFCFDATTLFHAGDNTIDVRADNTSRPDVIPINMNLFAMFGGIYRHVWLISTPKVCISPLEYGSPGVFVTESNVSKKNVDLAIKVDLQNFTKDYQKGEIQVQFFNGGKVQESAKATEDIPSGPIHPIWIHLSMHNPHLWQGRKDPFLYQLKVMVTATNQTDEVDQKIGIRTFSIVPNKGFYLNGKPYRLYGVCRHQDHENQGNAVSDAEQINDAAMIYDIGATAARLAHYQQSDVIYSAFDRDGVIVWAESPFVNASSGKEALNAMQQYKELILQNYNHACIAFWGCCNEVYGKTPQSYVPTLIRKLVNEGHELDSTRFICATSGTGNPTGDEVGYADVQGMNRYYGWYYGKTPDLAKWLNHMHQVRPGLVYALTEYGAGANLSQEPETLPSKINAEGKFFPENYQTKLHEESWLMIKKHPEVVASFIWNMFDFSDPVWTRGSQPGMNLKGLVTYDRKTKKDAFFWYKANWSKEPVLHILERRVTIRHISPMTIEVFCNKGIPALTLNGKPLPKMKPGINRVDWILPKVELRIGSNFLHADITVNGKKIEDSVIWDYSPTVDPSK